MEHLPTASSLLFVVPWLVPVMLAVTIVILILMRDPEYVPPHAVSRRLWCPSRRHEAIVEFREEVRSGMPLRRVAHCSLRADGACNEACGDLPRSRMVPLARAALGM